MVESNIQFGKRSKVGISYLTGQAANQQRKGGEIIWDDRQFPNRGFTISYKMNRVWFLKNIAFGYGINRKGVYTSNFEEIIDGIQKKANLKLTVKPWSFFEMSVGINYIEQREYQSNQLLWRGMTAENELFWQLSRNLFVNINYNAETQMRQYNLNFLTGFDFGTGNLLQIGFKASRNYYSFDYEQGFTFFIKFSYLLRV